MLERIEQRLAGMIRTDTVSRPVLRGSYVRIRQNEVNQ